VSRGNEPRLENYLGAGNTNDQSFSVIRPLHEDLLAKQAGYIFESFIFFSVIFNLNDHGFSPEIVKVPINTWLEEVEEMK